MRRFSIFVLAFLSACHYSAKEDPLTLIQIQDRNGLTETISNPDRLVSYETVDFLNNQPYKKVLRVYRGDGKNRSRITTYHPNGVIAQYLEAEEMRAHGAYREWFSNGQLKIEAKVIGGTADLASGAQEDWVFDAMSRVWDEQGHLIAAIPYDKGSLEGKSTYYYPSGQIERELFFAKNKLHGSEIEYWLNGVVKSKTQYKQGIKEGDSFGYFEEGAKAWVEEYSDGRLRDGSYFNLEGELISEVEKGAGFVARFGDGELTLIEYKVGRPEGLWRNFTSQGEMRKTFFTKGGMKHGEEIDYFLAADLKTNPTAPFPKLSIAWNENKIHGCVKTWYKNGSLQSQREYSRNQRMGPALAWYSDGSLMFYEEYEEDHLLSGQYYKRYQKDPVSSVSKGAGVATLFDENGGFFRKVTYMKGKPVDPEE